MIVCPACNHKNPEGSRFCSECGGPLDHFIYRACPSCGALNAPDAVFCSRCLAAIVSGAGAPEIETSQAEIPEIMGVPPTPSEEAAPAVGEPSAAPSAEPAPAQETAPEVFVAPSEAQAAPELSPLAAEGEPQAESAEPMPTPEAFVEPPELIGPQPAEQAVAVQPREQGAPEAAEQTPPAPPDVPQEAAAPAEGAIEEPPTLALAPTETASEEEINPLEGVAEALPVAPLIALPHRIAPIVERPREQDIQDADLFRQIATERPSLQGGARVRVAEVRSAPALPWLARVALYLAVLAIALMPWFFGGMATPYVQPRESVAAFERAMETLPAESVVLLAFDYGPMYAGELDALALALMRQLSSRSVRTVALSTKPEGVGSAERIYAALASEAPAYRYGEQYAILGYLPGQEVGLRALNKSMETVFKVDHVQQRPLGEMAVTRGLSTLRDAPQIVILADDGQSVRRWIEQVGGRGDVTLYALVTASVEPLLIPYQRSAQLRSLVGGATGAAEYEAASGIRPDALRGVDGYALLFVLLVLVAVVTNVVSISRS